MGACNNATYSLYPDSDHLHFSLFKFDAFCPLIEHIFQILKNLPSSCSSLNLTFGFKQITAVQDMHNLVPLFFFPL